MKKFSILLVTLIAISGCTPKVHHVGKSLEEGDIEQVKVGVHKKHEVAQILGSPTLYSLFKEDRWYYTSKVTEANAFLKPVASEQDTYIITFNKAGVVQNIRHLDLADVLEISYVNRETPTTGQDTSMLQQLFGNFGRITRGDKASPG